MTVLPTLITPDRLANLIMYSTRAAKLEGDMVEFGVYKGGSLELIAKTNPEKTVFGIDSFSGLPKESDFDFHREGDFSDGVDYHAIAGYFKMIHNNVRIVKGFSPDVFKYFREHHRFCFVHVDVDLHSSVIDACDFFYPRMTEGGIMIFDDYNWNSTPGATKAIDEFFKDLEPAYKGELKFADGEPHYQYLVIK